MIPACPRWFLAGVYLLYLGLTTTASVPLFADIDWLHEGERLGTAQILLDGGVPFRDVYLPHGLFPEVIRPLLAMWLLGESLAADRLMGLLLAPLTYVAAAFYLCKVFPTPPWRFVAFLGMALYPLQLISRHIIVFLALAFLSTWAYNQERRSRLVVAGIVTGLAYAASSIEQATFLLGTVLAFPVCLAAERVLVHRAGEGGGHGHQSWIQIMSLIVAPLLGGLLVGLLPLWGFLEISDTAQAFVRDFLTRILTDTVTRRDPYPELTLMNVSWYVVPAWYVSLAITILIRVWRFGDQRWVPILPTLLFGILSFSYAMRGCCPVYGKLATVSFPFIVSFIYVLWMIKKEAMGMGSSTGQTELSSADVWLLGLTGLGAGALLIQSITYHWSAKQIAPRFLFPVLALAILAAIMALVMGKVTAGRWREGLTIACPVAVLIVSTWFYNDTQPQVLAAQLMKPRLVKDAQRLVDSLALNKGKLTREQPTYLHDETLSYLTAASREGKRLVILATGAGMYYFLANVSPPNRFPEVYHAMADGPATEVVEGLDRTKAELLVACHDEGRSVTGWPMNPRLSHFIAANYVDSGRRLGNKLLGPNCPFSVWAHREHVKEVQG